MTEGLTYIELQQRAEDLEKRLAHLLQSRTVQLFDEVDIRTGEYKRNIQRLDTYGLRYKLTEYERTGVVPPNVAKIVQVRTQDVVKTAKALERLTKAINGAKEAWDDLFKDGEGSYEITPEVLP